MPHEAKKVKQKMPTGGYFLLDAAKTFAAQTNSNNLLNVTLLSLSKVST